jgi:DNA-binding NarL/FixJ family response regulator
MMRSDVDTTTNGSACHVRSRGTRAVVAELPASPRLTSREWEVLELMSRRLTNSQIARELTVSPVTVRTHVAAILRKLRVPDRDTAVRLFAP